MRVVGHAAVEIDRYAETGVTQLSHLVTRVLGTTAVMEIVRVAGSPRDPPADLAGRRAGDVEVLSLDEEIDVMIGAFRGPSVHEPRKVETLEHERVDAMGLPRCDERP